MYPPALFTFHLYLMTFSEFSTKLFILSPRVNCSHSSISVGGERHYLVLANSSVVCYCMLWILPNPEPKSDDSHTLAHASNLQSQVHGHTEPLIISAENHIPIATANTVFLSNSFEKDSNPKFWFYLFTLKILSFGSRDENRKKELLPKEIQCV